MIPDRMTLLHVDSNYILGRETDQLDVEYIVLRQFHLPTALAGF
jgi:hypothetical protein